MFLSVVLVCWCAVRSSLQCEFYFSEFSSLCLIGYHWCIQYFRYIFQIFHELRSYSSISSLIIVSSAKYHTMVLIFEFFVFFFKVCKTQHNTISCLFRSRITSWSFCAQESIFQQLRRMYEESCNRLYLFLTGSLYFKFRPFSETKTFLCANRNVYVGKVDNFSRFSNWLRTDYGGVL